MQRITISLLAVALVASATASTATTAMAQEEPAFGFEDAFIDAMPPAANAWADLVAGSAELADDGGSLRTTLVLAMLPEIQPGVAYVFLYTTDEGDERYTAAVAAPTLEFVMGRWEEGPATMTETTGAYSPGPAGRIHVDVPLGQLAGAAALSAPRALVLEIKPALLPMGGPVFELDAAQGAGMLALPLAAAADAAPAAVVEADAAPAKVPLGPLAPLLSLALAGGLARRVARAKEAGA